MAEKVARVRSIAALLPDVLSVDSDWVDPPRVTFRAGQFVSIRCGSGDVRRSYSIASRPAREDGFSLLVKLLPGGVGSALFGALSPGDALHMTGPMGFFVLDLSHAGDLVFAATGTGIAAALPMIEDALQRPGESGTIHLYWGMRSRAELYWEDELERLRGHPRMRVHLHLSRPEPDWPGARGRIVNPVLEALPGLSRPVFYLVGNGDMVKELKAGLVERGVDRKRQIRTEVFYPSLEVGARDSRRA